MYVRGDADSAIGHFESDDHRIDQILLKEGLNCHVALFSELDRVADEVREDLTELPRIAAQAGRYGGMHQAGDFQPFVLCLCRELTQYIFHRRAKVEVNTFQLQFACFDLAVRKDVVDQVE